MAWSPKQTRGSRLSGREEAGERKKFELDKYDTPVARPIVHEISEQFEKEKAWIEKRLRENREKFEEEVLFRVTEEDEQIILEGEKAQEDETTEASS